MAATMFSAFIFPPHVSVVLAAEQGTCPHVADQCGECKKAETDVQDVDHVPFEPVRALCRALSSVRMIRTQLLRPHKEGERRYKDFTKRPSVPSGPRMEATTVIAEGMRQRRPAGCARPTLL